MNESPETKKSLFVIFQVYSLSLCYAFLVFLFHHHYPLASLEVILCFCLLISFTALLSTISQRLSYQIEIVYHAFFFSLIWIILLDTNLFFSLLVFFINLAFLTFIEKKNLPISYVLFGTMLATLLLQQLFFKTPEKTSKVPNNKLAPVIHIMLDEAISPRYIPNSKQREQMLQFFKRNGFHLQTKAYSRFNYTHFSLVSLYNFIPAPTRLSDWIVFSKKLSRKESSTLKFKHNDYFNLLKKKGYVLTLIQSRYLDAEPDEAVNKISYHHDSINIYANSPIALSEKLKIILSAFLRQAKLLEKVLNYSKDLFSTTGLTPSSNMSTFNTIKNKITQLKNGEFLYVHLLLPHYPYFYDQQCEVIIRSREQALRFLSNQTFPKGLYELRNTKQSRVYHYQAYTQQYLCVLKQLELIFELMKKNNIFDKSYILIHGDHGSRISLRDPWQPLEKQLTKQDVIDHYSTLYALKTPFSVGKISNEKVTLDTLFVDYLNQIGIPNTSIVKNKKIHLIKGRFELGKEIDMVDE